MRKDAKKLLIIIGVAVLVLIILISIVIVKINATMKDENADIIDRPIINMDDISKEDEEKIEKYPIYISNSYIDSLNVEQRKSLIDLIDDVLEAINSQNYGLLYSKLNYLYAAAQFPTQKDFEKYMSKITYGATDYTCTYYNAHYYGFECFLTSKSQETVIELLLKPIDDTYKDYELVLRKDLIEVNERLHTFYVNNMNGTISYELLCADTLEFITKVKNNSNKSVTCSFGDSTLEALDWGTPVYYELTSPVENLNFAPNEEKDIVFVFKIKSTEKIRPSYINIACKIGENKKETRIYIDPTEDDLDF